MGVIFFSHEQHNFHDEKKLCQLMGAGEGMEMCCEILPTYFWNKPSPNTGHVRNSSIRSVFQRGLFQCFAPQFLYHDQDNFSWHKVFK